jgi:hypothetical protein
MKINQKKQKKTKKLKKKTSGRMKTIERREGRKNEF